MIVFWPECSKDIGMGHLAECLALADHARKEKRKTYFIISNFEAAIKLIEQKEFNYVVSDERNTSDVLRNQNLPNSISLLIINHRCVHIEKLIDARNKRIPIAVIDQLGNKAVACNLLINSSIVPDWHSYKFIGPKPKCCIGPNYAILRDEFRIQKNKRGKSNSRKVLLVTLGGIDRSGTTLRILEIIPKIKERIITKFIIGSGFLDKDKFINKYKKYKHKDIDYFLNVNNIAEHIGSSDIVLSAGGNTMYEIAYLGKPSLVLWEDPHEEKLSKAFEKLGCSTIIGNGKSSSPELISKHIDDLLANDKAQNEMAKNALQVLDGNGCSRIFNQINKLSFN